jgi:hypothetical protein
MAVVLQELAGKFVQAKIANYAFPLTHRIHSLVNRLVVAGLERGDSIRICRSKLLLEL